MTDTGSIWQFLTALFALGSALTGMDPGRSGQEGREDVSGHLQAAPPSMEVSGFTYGMTERKKKTFNDGWSVVFF